MMAVRRVGINASRHEIIVFGRNLTNYVHETPFYIDPLFVSGALDPGRSWGLALTAKF